MIDLRESGLPTALEVDGEAFPIDVDFRTWIRFAKDLEDSGVARYYIFTEDVPTGRSWVPVAVAFLESKCETPRATGRRAPRVIDYVEDGERIVASFQSAYGIDLTDPSTKMHWHRFSALLRGLPEDTCMSRVIGYRSWQKSSRKHEDVMRELRERYRLPEPGELERRAAVLELADEIFG